MNIVTRYSHDIRITDYTTAGIAAKLLGINIVTFKEKVKKGLIPAHASGTDRTDRVFRVMDIVRYATINDFPLNRTKLSDFSGYYTPSEGVDKIYCHAVENISSLTVNSTVVDCNLRQLLYFFDYDPFNWFVIGSKNGESYQTQLRHELLTIAKPREKKQQPFAYRITLTDNIDSIITDMTHYNHRLKGIVV